MKKVLVVEDESAIREFVVINLKRRGYETVEAEDGETALRLFFEEGGFSIVLLDVMMPGIDGVRVCREIRKADDTVGIIMLTARSQDVDKVKGFNNGADDYITKPFSPPELMLRVDSLYRRVQSSIEAKEGQKELTETLTVGDFTLDLRHRTLKIDDEAVDLTQVEFQILEFLITNPDKEFSREEILDRVWGSNYFGQNKIVDVNIRRLRMKVEEDASRPRHIVTVWGLGYKWEN